MTQPVVRFAPSPTGRLHIGNARPALLNALFALNHGGRFILRFDDTDRERSKAEYADAIATDLAWLGIRPDLVVRQSDRTALYDAAADRLRAAGRLYACYETEDELDRRRKRQAARGLPPIYDRAALKLTDEEKRAFEAQGRKPHWRFLLEHRTVEWDDLVRGPCHVDGASLSDPVLIRADGTYLYTLPSVVDDVDLGVTHVIRGEDHVTNTAVQIQIIEALAGPGSAPAFGHHNLLTTASGEGLSKRLGHLSLGSLRDQGIEPLAVDALAVLVGSAEAVRPVRSLEELAQLVDLGRLSRAPARFDEAELHALNAKVLHHLEFADVADRLRELGAPADDRFWLAVRGNCSVFNDVVTWATVARGPVTPVIEDLGFCEAAAALLPPEPWGDETWGAWTRAVAEATGRKGKALFMPLRLALTGLDHGPELKAMLPLIGRERALGRLGGAVA
ncbi:glutamate--tRNA ligase [Alsobacter soli]|uniref:Glutamate--tRNA ligase n=1 Tax=Alsobacter soli TaxID=2109933 RepID=A0A2T1HVU2_9HYPH|nr:glutamate--tRNA ligase [Alsobacter soli]PSC05730.1 glutamate--tRNA ligase [Alsobacter soli]